MPCVAGSVAAAGSAACTTCTAGKYADPTGKSTCLSCQAGNYSLSGSTACSICQPGFYSAAESSTCTACEEGKHASLAIQSPSCTLCIAGTYSSTVGAWNSSTCLPCVGAKYSSTPGSTACQTCAADFPAQTGHTICRVTACTSGEVPLYAVLTGNGTNDVGCVRCSDLAPVKTRWENPAAAGTCAPCKACSSSEYAKANCSSAVDTHCLPCPVCVAGTSYYTRNCSTYEASECQDCPAACRLGVEYETVACTLYTKRECAACSSSCPLEQYISASCSAKDNIKCLACRNCSAGEYVSVPCTQDLLAKNRECTSCPAGSFSSSQNAGACAQCEAGTYAPESKATVCLRCSAGTYISNKGASACLACGEGKYSIVSGVSTCLTCPPASYLQNATTGLCTVCPAGKYNFEDGMTYCKSCQPGTFSAVNSTNCTKCPLGFFVGEAGRANNCSACAPGTYAGETGQTRCKDCPAGTYASFPGASACTACGPGNFSAGAGAVACDPCPVGTRSNSTTGSSSCTTCEPGKYASTKGLSSCLTCAANCILGKTWTEVDCTPSTNRVCSLCRRNPLCPKNQTSNVTWCPPDGWFACTACPNRYGNDYVHLNPEYSCLTCDPTNCGLTPGTYQASSCAVKTNYSLDDTYACGRCPGCNYRQYVVDWGPCDGTGDSNFPLNPEFSEHCAYCNPGCKVGQYATNLCTGRTKMDTETCANCTSCAYGFYHAKELSGLVYPAFEGGVWVSGYKEPSCDGKGILNSDGATDCVRCDSCANGWYASDVKRCTGNGIWKDNFTCTECKPCASGYEHVVPCDGLSFNDSCKLCPACAAGFYAVSTWNSTSKRMVCGCKRCLDAPGDVCPVHFFKTGKTCSGRMPYDEACEECSLCNAGEYIAGGAFCTGATFEDTSAGKCRWVNFNMCHTHLETCLGKF